MVPYWLEPNPNHHHWSPTSSRWKMPAASAASASPSLKASSKCSGQPAPLLAITGKVQQDFTWCGVVTEVAWKKCWDISPIIQKLWSWLIHIPWLYDLFIYVALLPVELLFQVEQTGLDSSGCRSHRRKNLREIQGGFQLEFGGIAVSMLGHRFIWVPSGKLRELWEITCLTGKYNWQFSPAIL